MHVCGLFSDPMSGHRTVGVSATNHVAKQQNCDKILRFFSVIVSYIMIYNQLYQN